MNTIRDKTDFFFAMQITNNELASRIYFKSPTNQFLKKIEFKNGT